VKGATGASGAQGAGGSNGATGASGATGTAGLAGISGSGGGSGAKGVTGAEGASGATGAIGASGATGASATGGESGATGASGQTGAAGEAITGATGAEGATGATGPAGPTGSTGVTGSSGGEGANGATGATGGQGPPGSAGALGATGPGGSTELPKQLEAGKTEVGYWSVSTGHLPEAPPHVSQGRISFPVPLKKRLSEQHVRYLQPKEVREVAEGKRAVKACKAAAGADPNLLEEPVAEPGYLCVYAGFQEEEDEEEVGIVGTGEHEAEAGRYGASVEFRLREIPSEESEFERDGLRAQGTWAVTGE
jgi:hypothetical protein